MNDPEAQPATPPVRRSLFLFVMKWVTILCVVGFVVYAGLFKYRWDRHRQISDRMETAITRLALHCPPDLTEDEWAYCILWTWNLHGNYGVVPSYVPTDDLERIVAELETRIDAGPSLATIDWLWDEYFRAYPHARWYEQFRPTLPANEEEFKAGAHGGHPLSYWRSEYERRVTKQ